MTDSTEPRAEGLKPCPFCGGEAYETTRDDEDIWTHNIVPWTQVGCWECNFFFEGPPGIEPTPAEHWNTRPTTDTVERAAVLAEIEDTPWSGNLADRHELLSIIRALPSAAGGEDKLRELEAAAQRALEVLRQIAVKRRGIGPLATAAQDAAWQLSAALQQEPTK